MPIVSEKMLDARAAHLNKLTNSPSTPFKRENGVNIGQIGNYHIYASCGAWALHRIANTSGGVTEIAFGKTKAILLGRIEAYERGLRDAMSKPVE